MKNLIKTVLSFWWNKTDWSIKSITFFLFFALVVNLLPKKSPEEMAAYNQQVQQEQAQKRKQDNARRDLKMARLEVAANHVDKYSPYTCGSFTEDTSYVSLDNTAHLFCDQRNNFEVKTVNGVVFVKLKS